MMVAMAHELSLLGSGAAVRPFRSFDGRTVGGAELPRAYPQRPGALTDPLTFEKNEEISRKPAAAGRPGALRGGPRSAGAAPNLLVERRGLGAGLDPELVLEGPLQPPVLAQRLGPLAAAKGGLDQSAARLLVDRIVLDQAPERVGGLVVAPGLDRRLRERAVSLEPQLLEALLDLEMPLTR